MILDLGINGFKIIKLRQFKARALKLKIILFVGRQINNIKLMISNLFEKNIANDF